MIYIRIQPDLNLNTHICLCDLFYYDWLILSYYPFCVFNKNQFICVNLVVLMDVVSLTLRRVQ